MTREYAALSIRCGILAGRTDQFLGTDEFSSWARAAAWNLSPEWIDRMKAGARQLGVPQEVLEEAEQQAQEVVANERIIEKFSDIQAESDKNWGLQ